MKTVIHVASDLLREAMYRKWFIGLAAAITLLLFTTSLSLRMDVVDGAIAGTRLFGKVLSNEMQAADVSLRPLFVAVTYIIFYAGILFGTMACADFAPALLSPGRIEHLLALPVRRWQLLLGTFLGVLSLGALGALYGSGGLVVILGVKTGVWTIRPMAGALLAVVAFSCVYAVMLLAALFVRNAGVSAAMGLSLFIVSIVASYRLEIANAFSEGVGRSVFKAASLVFPRIALLADAAAGYVSHDGGMMKSFWSVLVGILTWTCGALVIAIYRFEGKDF